MNPTESGKLSGKHMHEKGAVAPRCLIEWSRRKDSNPRPTDYKSEVAEKPQQPANHERNYISHMEKWLAVLFCRFWPVFFCECPKSAPRRQNLILGNGCVPRRGNLPHWLPRQWSVLTARPLIHRPVPHRAASDFPDSRRVIFRLDHPQSERSRAMLLIARKYDNALKASPAVGSRI